MQKQNRLRALENQVARLERRLSDLYKISNRYSWIRVGIFLAGLFLSLAAFYLVDIFVFWAILITSIVAFSAIVYPHRQVDHQIRRHEIWHEIKKSQIARMTLDWQQLGGKLPRQADPKHPFEADINLVGERSLLRVLDMCVLREGSQRLYEWLAKPIPDLEQIVKRQALVGELIELATFRSQLILAARLAGGGKKEAEQWEQWEVSKLQAWVQEHQPGTSLAWWALLLTALAVVNAILFVFYWFGFLPPIWLGSFLLYMFIFLVKTGADADLFRQALELQGALKQLSAVSSLLEGYPYRNSPHLRALCEPFVNPQQRPSQYLKRMNRITTAIGLQQNPYMAFMLNALMPWNFYCAYWLNEYKTELAPHLLIWLDKWIELEALGSLANLAYLNPDYTLPDVIVDEKQAKSFVFQARGLGHPLIPDGEKVCNDFSVRSVGEIGLITGSNMAGKSSFLRALAMNLTLAYAGGPVNAEHLQTIPFRLFTTINVTDSVTDGISYFYAEVKRLKALLSALETEHPFPLFFLIDEIFRGTNNRERLIGSRAYIRALTGQHGVGLISTHDLELVKLADEMAQIKNYHFREEVIGQQMVFDYTLRTGPCPTTNALKIMQLEGLPVTE
ncbi:MAG: MutS-related protein [Ardenticatenaceae bacterium]